jgi:hypothetical protein
MLTLSTLTILPAALVAQAPPVNVSQQLKSEQPLIDRLVKEMKAKEALVKAEALIALERPAYDNKDLNTVAQSQNTWRDLVIAHLLAARTAFTAGEWEKGGEILQKGLSLAKDNQAAFVSGAKGTLDTWKGPEADAKAFLADKAPRIDEIRLEIAKADSEAANADAIKKMNKADKAAFDGRQAKAKAGAEELKQLESAKLIHENNLKLAEKIHGFVDSTTKLCDDDIKTVSTAIEKSQARIKIQADEIQAFNTKQKEAKKKVVIKGNSNWVDAVMNDHENVTKLVVPETQVSFLNRLLVLDPGNAKAQKALDNIVAGKAPFDAEKAPKGKGKAKKSR